MSNPQTMETLKQIGLVPQETVAITSENITLQIDHQPEAVD